MKSIDRQPSGDTFQNALSNPLLSQTGHLPPIDRFNISAFNSETKPYKLKPKNIIEANERGASLVARAHHILESPPQPGIHLEVGLGEDSQSNITGTQMHLRISEGYPYTAEAPYIAVDGGATVPDYEDRYRQPSHQEIVRNFFERTNREMAKQGLSDVYQYRVGDGNNLAAAGIEDESVVELCAENLLFTMTNQEIHRMLREFHRVMMPGGLLAIREYYRPVRLDPSHKKEDLLSSSRGTELGLAAALDAAGFTERGVDRLQPDIIVAFKSSPEITHVSRWGSLKPGWLRGLNRSN